MQKDFSTPVFYSSTRCLNKVGALSAQLCRNSPTVCSGVTYSRAFNKHLLITCSSFSPVSALDLAPVSTSDALLTVSTTDNNKMAVFITQCFSSDITRRKLMLPAQIKNAATIGGLSYIIFQYNEWLVTALSIDST